MKKINYEEICDLAHKIRMKESCVHFEPYMLVKALIQKINESIEADNSESTTNPPIKRPDITIYAEPFTNKFTRISLTKDQTIFLRSVLENCVFDDEENMVTNILKMLPKCKNENI